MTGSELIDAARGAVTCDLNLANCTLLDLLRGEMRKNMTISIRRGRVAGVDDGLHAERTLDLKGMFLAPGLVDSHVHIESSMLSPPEYARIVAPRGTTAVVADPHEIANVLGYDGMRYMLASSESLPIDVYFMVPSCVPATGFDTAGAALYASDMYPFLREPRVLGLGEVMNYPGVLYKDQHLLDKISSFPRGGKKRRRPRAGAYGRGSVGIYRGGYRLGPRVYHSRGGAREARQGHVYHAPRRIHGQGPAQSPAGGEIQDGRSFSHLFRRQAPQ